MADLTTLYMGLKLSSPVIVGSCSLSKQIDNIKAAEEAGAGALVIKSLFEEQLQHEAMKLEEELEKYNNMIVESLSFHPAMEHGGPKEHLMWLEKARAAVKMPIIASLNAFSPGKWSDYAVQLQDTGVDALELNLYGVVTDFNVSGAEVLNAMLATFKQVKSKVKIPVAVKLSPYFASPAHVTKAFDDAGADALVLFNKFAMPYMDLSSDRLSTEMVMSCREDMGNSLRWMGLLFGRVNADLCANTGIHDGNDVVKMILAGADAVQMVSAVMSNGIGYISKVNQGIADYMHAREYTSLAAFRGKLSAAKQINPYAYERAQYVKALLGFD